jgi:hypothetical protein
LGLLNFVSGPVGLAVRGDEFSIAAAYAFDRVLNAVGDEGSMSDFSAVVDFPSVTAVAGVLICNDSRGRLGGTDG